MTNVSKQKKYSEPLTARQEKGWTIRQLADRAEISATTVWQIEKDRRLPLNRHIRYCYLQALGLSEDQIHQARPLKRKRRDRSTYRGGRPKGSKNRVPL